MSWRVVYDDGGSVGGLGQGIDDHGRDKRVGSWTQIRRQPRGAASWMQWREEKYSQWEDLKRTHGSCQHGPLNAAIKI